MRILKATWIFYQKLIVPALVLAGLIGLVGLGLTGAFSFKSFGISYFISGLLFHYFVYEIRNPNEYYFYYNIGLNRATLWIITFILGLIIALIFIIYG